MIQRKILVVEDEIIIARDIEKKLTALNYEVTGLVGSGKEAIEHCGTNPPDLVLMDIMIKGQMDGIETACRIKDMFEYPVIFLTAHSDETTLKRAKTAEPYGYILKPIQPKEFQITIEMALYKADAEKTLKEMRMLLLSVLNTQEKMAVIIDNEERVIMANALFLDFVGMNSATIKGKEANQYIRRQKADSGHATVKSKFSGDMEMALTSEKLEYDDKTIGYMLTLS